jgi:hypothetical protein
MELSNSADAGNPKITVEHRLSHPLAQAKRERLEAPQIQCDAQAEARDFA